MAETKNNNQKKDEQKSKNIPEVKSEEVELKRASDLTKVERESLQTVLVQVMKNVSRSGRTYYTVKFQIVKDKFYVEYRSRKTPFTDNHWLLMCEENNLNINAKQYVIKAPVRFFTGFTQDEQSGELRKYTRYQLFISEHLILSGFFSFTDVTLMERLGKKYKIIETNKEIDFENMEDSEF